VESARLAQFSDITQIVSVLTVIQDRFAPKRGGMLFIAEQAELGAMEARVAAAIADPDQVAIVGVYDDVVLGFCLGRLVGLAGGGEDGRLGRIELIAVDPDARAVGIGEAMMDAVTDWFISHDCVGMESQALPGDRETKNFFESFGMKARLLILHRDLDSDPKSTIGHPATHPDAPVVGVGAVIVHDGRILMVKRGTDPSMGLWSVPGGKVDPSESLSAAVEREVREETGLEVSCGPFIGHAESIGRHGHYVILDFYATVNLDLTEPLRPGSDASEAAWIDLDRVLELELVPNLGSFLTDHSIVAKPSS